jgi:hypothetical protein
LRSNTFELTSKAIVLDNNGLNVNRNNVTLLAASEESVVLQTYDYKKGTSVNNGPGYYYRLADAAIGDIVFRHFDTGKETGQKTIKTPENKIEGRYRLECEASGAIIRNKIPGKSYSGYRVHSNDGTASGFVSVTYKGDNDTSYREVFKNIQANV